MHYHISSNSVCQLVWNISLTHIDLDSKGTWQRRRNTYFHAQSKYNTTRKNKKQRSHWKSVIFILGLGILHVVILTVKTMFLRSSAIVSWKCVSRASLSAIPFHASFDVLGSGIQTRKYYHTPENRIHTSGPISTRKYFSSSKSIQRDFGSEVLSWCVTLFI